ncbi:MAG: FAD:protein FMN transferase [Acidobacteriota bacterium]
MIHRYRARPAAWAACSLSILGLLAALTFTPAVSAQPVRLAMDGFGGSVEIEIRGLAEERARALAERALAEIHQVVQLTDSSGPIVPALNALAGQPARTVDPRLALALERAQGFCGWSNGAYGPLGGRLYTLWDAGVDALASTDPDTLLAAAQSSACTGLQIRSEATAPGAPGPLRATVQLARDAQVDLRGIAQGLAVDRAMAVLREAGVTNAWVGAPHVCRALGLGPEGLGWLAVLPSVGEMAEAAEPVWLRDQALAFTPVDGRPWRRVHQRTGRPTPGVAMVVTVTELAMDAQGLASSLQALGLQQGSLRLGQLKPKPAVLWLLGDGTGMPVTSHYQWAELTHQVETAGPESLDIR